MILLIDKKLGFNLQRQSKIFGKTGCEKGPKRFGEKGIVVTIFEHDAYI